MYLFLAANPPTMKKATEAEERSGPSLHFKYWGSTFATPRVRQRISGSGKRRRLNMAPAESHVHSDSFAAAVRQQLFFFGFYLELQGIKPVVKINSVPRLLLFFFTRCPCLFHRKISLSARSIRHPGPCRPLIRAADRKRVFISKTGEKVKNNFVSRRLSK